MTNWLNISFGSFWLNNEMLCRKAIFEKNPSDYQIESDVLHRQGGKKRKSSVRPLESNGLPSIDPTKSLKTLTMNIKYKHQMDTTVAYIPYQCLCWIFKLPFSKRLCVFPAYLRSLFKNVLILSRLFNGVA